MKNEPLSVKEIAEKMGRDIANQREEILRAFIAKYGMQPDEVEQVEQYSLDGIRWYVRKRDSWKP